MSVGWGAMSGAAINIILAPWFQRRRGLAVSLAFNGATLGGVLIAPALIFLIEAVGFTRALPVAGPSATGAPRSRADALRTWRFWSVSAPFALGLAAQVGVLTHLVSLVAPTLGSGGAARAVSATTAAGVGGRLLTGF